MTKYHGPGDYESQKSIPEVLDSGKSTVKTMACFMFYDGAFATSQVRPSYFVLIRKKKARNLLWAIVVIIHLLSI